MEYRRTAIGKELRFIIKNWLGINVDQLSGQTTLSSVGLDSTDVRDLMEHIEHRFNIRVNCKPFVECFTLDESVAWLEDLLDRKETGHDEAILPEGAD